MRIQTEEAVAYKPALARPLAGDSHCGVGEGRAPSIARRKSRRPTASSRWAARRHSYMPLLFAARLCLVPNIVLSKSRHDSLDSPSTLGIWVRSPLAWGRKDCPRRGDTCWAMLGWLDATYVQQVMYSSSCALNEYIRVTMYAEVPASYGASSTAAV